MSIWHITEGVDGIRISTCEYVKRYSCHAKKRTFCNSSAPSKSQDRVHTLVAGQVFSSTSPYCKTLEVLYTDRDHIEINLRHPRHHVLSIAKARRSQTTLSECISVHFR